MFELVKDTLYLTLTGDLRVFILNILTSTHFSLLTPYGDKEMGQHWLR